MEEWHKCIWMFLFPLKNLARKGLNEFRVFPWVMLTIRETQRSRWPSSTLELSYWSLSGAWISNHMPSQIYGMKLLIHSQTSTVAPLSLGIDELFHPTMLGVNIWVYDMTSWSSFHDVWNAAYIPSTLFWSFMYCAVNRTFWWHISPS